MTTTLRNFTEEKVFHIYNRGCERRVLFHGQHDYEFFIALIEEYSNTHKISIRQFCIMPNHYHFLLTPIESFSLSKFMHSIGLNYACYYQRINHTHGHVWDGKYKSKLVTTESYYHTLIKYIEENPVRANLVGDASEWQYSSKTRVLQSYS